MTERVGPLLPDETYEHDPNVVTYGILIDHLCKSWRFDDVLNVFDEMSTMDVVVCNMVVDGLGKAGRVGEALGVLDRMWQMG